MALSKREKKRRRKKKLVDAAREVRNPQLLKQRAAAEMKRDAEHYQQAVDLGDYRGYGDDLIEMDEEDD